MTPKPKVPIKIAALIVGSFQVRSTFDKRISRLLLFLSDNR